MKLTKLRKKILLLLLFYISTNTSDWLLFKTFEELPKERRVSWGDAYSYGLVFDFSPRWRK